MSTIRAQIDIRDRSLTVFTVDAKGNAKHVKTVVATADTPVVSYDVETAPAKKEPAKKKGKG